MLGWSYTILKLIKPLSRFILPSSPLKENILSLLLLSSCIEFRDSTKRIAFAILFRFLSFFLSFFISFILTIPPPSYFFSPQAIDSKRDETRRTVHGQTKPTQLSRSLTNSRECTRCRPRRSLGASRETFDARVEERVGFQDVEYRTIERATRGMIICLAYTMLCYAIYLLAMFAQGALYIYRGEDVAFFGEGG